ncbi:MAG: hypothetical protein ACP5NX_04625 [Candidatus Bilamarchaeaceae archaeon]
MTNRIKPSAGKTVGGTRYTSCETDRKSRTMKIHLVFDDIRGQRRLETTPWLPLSSTDNLVASLRAALGYRVAYSLSDKEGGNRYDVEPNAEMERNALLELMKDTIGSHVCEKSLPTLLSKNDLTDEIIDFLTDPRADGKAKEVISEAYKTAIALYTSNYPYSTDYPDADGMISSLMAIKASAGWNPFGSGIVELMAGNGYGFAPELRRTIMDVFTEPGLREKAESFVMMMAEHGRDYALEFAVHMAVYSSNAGFARYIALLELGGLATNGGMAEMKQMNEKLNADPGGREKPEILMMLENAKAYVGLITQNREYVN